MRVVPVAVVSVFCVLAFGSADRASGQVAGSTTIGVTVENMKTVALGWSAKKQVLNKTVYNENKEKVGVIDDLIIAPDGSLSFAIVGAGGFVGLGRHDIAIPIEQLKTDGGTFVLPGATKAAIKALPKFEYAKQ
jgi:sporulation protein YlmC with PRC-barrel domain